MSEVIELKNEFSGLNSNQAVNSDAKDETRFVMDLVLRYGFTIGEYNLLIPEGIESEVITTPEIFPIPNTSDLMVGLVSVRGQFAPVFKLGKMLEIGREDRATSIIVLNINGKYLAFQCEKALSLELPPSVSEKRLDLPDTVNQFAGDIYQTNQGFWIEFDFKSCMDQFSTKISHE